MDVDFQYSTLDLTLVLEVLISFTIVHHYHNIHDIQNQNQNHMCMRMYMYRPVMNPGSITEHKKIKNSQKYQQIPPKAP